MITRLFKILPLLTVCCAVFGFGWIAWSAYNEANKTPIEQLQIISSENTSIKHKPDDEGGMKISHKDKEVYAVITDTKGNKKAVETLLPQEEKPVVLPKKIIVDEELKKGKKIIVDDELKKGKVIVVDEALTKVKTVRVDDELKNKVIKIENTAGDGEHFLETFNVKPVFKPKKFNNNSPKNEAVISSYLKKTGDYSIQLGAYKTDAEAKKAWKKISVSYADLVGNLTHYVRKVSIENEDFHRLRVGYFKTKKKANSLCDKFKAKKQGCFVVN